MGGFLSGLGTLLGGFSDVKQIDKEGFDFREKRAQEQFLRDRQQELARQADEDRTLSQLGDVLAGQEGEPDVTGVESMLPQEVDSQRRQWMSRVALGQLPERKSRIEATKAYARVAQEEARGANQLAAIGARGDEAQELAKLQSKLRAGQPMNEYERRRMDVLEQGLQQRGTRARRKTYTKIGGVDPSGATGTWLIDNETGDREFVPAGKTAVTRGKEESRGAAMAAFDELMGVYDSFGGQPEGGVEARVGGLARQGAAAAGYDPDVRVYQAGVRGFVPLMARALGHSGVLTELDIERTEALFPTPRDTAVEAEQKKRILRDIMAGQRQPPFKVEPDTTPSALAPLRQAGTGAGEVRTYRGQQYRLKPGADRRLQSSWELIR